MFKINTIPGRAAKEKGYAHYPEDFPHLTHGADFAAWRSGDDWEIETILVGQALVDRCNSFFKSCENGIRIWEVKYRYHNGSVDFLWYGSLVDEAEAKRRNRDMEASGLEILGMRPVNGLPPNKLYLEMVKKANEEVSNARNKK